MSTNKEITISKKMLVTIMSIFIVIIVIVSGIVIMRKPKAEGITKQPNVVTESSGNGKTFEEMQNATDASLIGVKMNINPVFKDSNSMGNLMLENTSSNGNSFVTRIVINEGNQEVYKSGLIEVGVRVDEIKLTSQIKKGEYDAIAYFSSYNENEEIIGTSGINMKLIIQN